MNFIGRTEENHEKPSQYNRSQCRDMNSEPPEHNAEALLNQLLLSVLTHKGRLRTTNLFESNLLTFLLTLQFSENLCLLYDR
jgi:hypothetical protein